MKKKPAVNPVFVLDETQNFRSKSFFAQDDTTLIKFKRASPLLKALQEQADQIKSDK